MSTTMIIIAAIALLAFWAVGIYNHLIRLRNQVQNAWSQIDVQLQRRYDLIPNLVETVKGYMNFEKGTLESIVQARTQAQAARQAVDQQGGPTQASIAPLVAAEGNLNRALGSFWGLVEGYPELKASETMKNLQEELSSTENKIAFARQAYNDQVLAYNTAQQTFPSNIFASFFGHHPAELYELSDVQAKQPVKVSF